MSLQTPSIKDISDNIIAQLEAALNQTIPALPKSFLRVLAKVLAGVFILLYKYAGFMFLQIFVATAANADTDIFGVSVNPLVFWGRLIGIGDPTPATNAVLNVQVFVEVQEAKIIPSGTTLLKVDTGVTYMTLADVDLDVPGSPGLVPVDVKAVADQTGAGGAGAIGNLPNGETIQWTNPVPNVSKSVIVVSTVETGVDKESTEVYRQRILDKFQRRPQGGAYSDYRLWAEEVPGIINAYVYTSTTPGVVSTYCEATVASSGSPDGIPTQAQLDAVEESIQFDINGLASRRPAGAFSDVLAITRTAFEVEVIGLTIANEAEAEAQIVAALDLYFFDREPYIVGLSVPPRKDQISQSAVAGIVEGIVTSLGGIFLEAKVFVATVETPLYVLGEGEKAKVDNVVFT